MNNQPLVSVLMTAYNREKYIAQAIESVLTSGYKNFELIIVDDGSKDNTVNIARSFAENDARVRLYVNEENLGDYPNRNQAAEYARGEYIKYLDSDDYFLPGGLEYCISMMINNPEADWGMYYNLEYSSNTILSSRQSIHDHFFKKPFLLIGPGGTILKKDFFFNVGKFPTIYGPANDLYFNLKAASKGKLLLLKQDFFHYRVHNNQERNNKFLYLVNLYNHLNDAIHSLELGLSAEEERFIIRKNKRRFITNSLEYLLRGKEIKKISEAIRLTNFRMADALQGIFH